MKDLYAKKSYNSTVNHLPRTIDGVDYEIRKASGRVASRFLDAKTATFKANKYGKIQHIQGLGDLPAILLSMTLFRDGNPVSKSKILEIDVDIQEDLYNDSLDFSNLREKDENITSQLKELLGDDWDHIKEEALSKEGNEFRFLQSLFTEEEDKAENF